MPTDKAPVLEEPEQSKPFSGQPSEPAEPAGGSGSAVDSGSAATGRVGAGGRRWAAAPVMRSVLQSWSCLGRKSACYLLSSDHHANPGHPCRSAVPILSGGLRQVPERPEFAPL